MDRPRLSVITIGIIAVTMCFQISVSAETANTSWPMFQHDTRHTGQTTAVGNPTGDVAWTFNTGAAIYASPVIGQFGDIYIGNYSARLFCIDSRGVEKWTYPTKNAIESTVALSREGTIYFGDIGGTFYALHPNGALAWEYIAGGPIYSSPSIAPDGTIYFTCHDTYLYALNPNGTLKWKWSSGGKMESSPAIGSDGTIYIGSEPYQLYAINPDGSMKWLYLTSDKVLSSPAITTGHTCYAGCQDNDLYAINPDGSFGWQYSTNNLIHSSSPAIAKDGTVYVTSYDTLVHAVNPNGTLKWTFPTGNVVFASPVIDDYGVVYIGNWSGDFYAINPNGSEKWKINVGPWKIYGSAAIADDTRIYVADENGIITCLGNLFYGVQVHMPLDYYSPGDIFWAEAEVSSPFPTGVADAKLFGLLEVYGQFWYWPSWSSTMDYKTFNLSQGALIETLISSFAWPSGVGAGYDLAIWGAILNPAMTDIMGSYDVFYFSYGV